MVPEHTLATLTASSSSPMDSCGRDPICRPSELRLCPPRASFTDHDCSGLCLAWTVALRDSLEPGLVLVERVVVCRLKGQGMVGPVISVIPMLDTPSLVPTAKNIKRRPLFRTCRSLCYAAEKSASCPDLILYPRWCVDDFR